LATGGYHLICLSPLDEEGLPVRAFALDDFGVSPTLRDLPPPTPEPGEVVIRIQASSVNGFDLAVASGMIKGYMEHQFPLVLGRDFAGTVEAASPEASRFAVGERVFGVVLKPVLHDGAFGEYVTMPEVYGVTKIPDGLDFASAGALGLAGTAALMSVEAVAPSAGETILISGATGGVGAYAIQMCVSRGATVIATAKPGEEADFVRGLGATSTVDYTGDVVGAVRSECPDGVDALIHLAGDASQLADTLKSGGRLASTLILAPDAFAGRPITVTGIAGDPSVTRLDRLAEDAAAGRLRITIQRTYSLDQIPQAFADFAAGTLGKLAVTIA
jgi:NADPH:quinone reductase-like Zn-dependent oxidoreductase